MPSEVARERRPPALMTWLRSQGLGVFCGLTSALLLAVGSFVIAATRGGASAGLALDDVRWFFEHPSPAHAWFYALLPVLGLYGLNTAVATWHSVSIKWRNGFRDPRAYAPALFHVGFLVALVAHLVGGVGGGGETLLLDADWRALPDGREARVLSVETERLPDGMPRTVRARVELRAGPEGSVEPATIGFNEPLSSGFGARLVLLQRPVALPAAALLEAGGERCAVRPGASCRIGGYDVALIDLRDGGPHGTMARVEVGRGEGWLVRGAPQPLDEGTALTLVEVERRTGIVVTWRRAPGNPWALGAALLLVAGVALMWRRLV